MLRNTTVVAAILIAFSAHAQSSRPAFEVASIKPNDSNTLVGFPEAIGHRFVASNTTLKRVLAYAYGTKEQSLLTVYQIAGGPSWIDSDRFDIEARWPDDLETVQEQVRQMVQRLLEERFQLKAHWITREMPIYNLIVAKGGLKMTLSENQTKPNPIAGILDNQVRGKFEKSGTGGALKLTLRSAPVTSILGLLQNSADAPIVDKTGLTGLYDAQLELEYSYRDLSLIPEQLGLKLERSKGPVEVLVIDSVQKPSEN